MTSEEMINSMKTEIDSIEEEIKALYNKKMEKAKSLAEEEEKIRSEKQKELQKNKEARKLEVDNARKEYEKLRDAYLRDYGGYWYYNFFS